MNESAFEPLTFLGLPSDKSDYANSRVVIVPVGYEATISYQSGTRDGPIAIILASRYLEYFDAELGIDVSQVGIFTLPPLIPNMAGPQALVEQVETLSDSLLADEKFVVLLGGEHTISLGLVRALQRQYPTLGVLQIDAHLDLRNTYDGTPYNHACVMRRIAELCPVVQVGIRSVAEEEHAYVASQGWSPFYAWQLSKIPDWPSQVSMSLPKDVYITIDLDGLDPSIMPSVGTPEPGGLKWYELTELLAKVGREHHLVGCDVVELRPSAGFTAPNYIASRLVYRLIGLAHLDWLNNTRGIGSQKS